MVASIPLSSISAFKLPTYFLYLLAVAVLIWPTGVMGQSSMSDNVVVQWDAAALQGVRDSRIGPPMVSRALAIAHTCMFDAWAAYDKRAVGTQFGDKLRRPKTERTLANKNEAISFAAYRALVDLFALDKASVFTPRTQKITWLLGGSGRVRARRLRLVGNSAGLRNRDRMTDG
jgi:hypothetical protein